jgi:PAS domain S-box-containing protein
MVKILGYDDKEDLMSIDIKTQLYFDLSDRDSAILTEQFEEMAVYPLKKKDGSKIWVEDHGWLVNDAHGNTLFHEGILRDVTDRVQIELQLQKYAVDLKVSNETKDKLFSIIAHDLRSPFNSILGFSQLLFDEYQSFSDEEKKSFIFKIKQSAEKTLTLLENLLTWARLQQGAFKVSPEKNDLYLIAGQQIELLRHTADLKKISLISAISPGTFIQVDRAMIKTVLLNLISNAIKFTVPEGIITLNSRKQGKQVEISVTDTGIGISSDDLESLFKVGHIRSTLGTSNETGTGLGLIICKEFVELNGGHIWAESEAGKGSTFFFTVPSNIVQG